MPDDEDRSRDATGGAGAGSPDADQPDISWADATAPDDISELTRDVVAYRREVRAALRRERYGRFALGPTAAPLTMTVAALAIVAVIAAVLTVMGPKRAQTPGPLQLATTSVMDGARGGLLPNLSLRAGNNTPVAMRSLRPAVIAVVPVGCDCASLVHDAAISAGDRDIPLYAVLPSGQSADNDSFGGIAKLEPSAIFTDTANDAFETAIGPVGLTIDLVNRNGTIYDVEQKASSATIDALPGDLLKMLETSG